MLPSTKDEREKNKCETTTTIVVEPSHTYSIGNRISTHSNEMKNAEKTHLLRMMLRQNMVFLVKTNRVPRICDACVPEAAERHRYRSTGCRERRLLSSVHISMRTVAAPMRFNRITLHTHNATACRRHTAPIDNSVVLATMLLRRLVNRSDQSICIYAKPTPQCLCET